MPCSTSASCGDHVVASSTIYGGTFNLISVTMTKMGIEFTFVDPDCTEEELDAAFRPNTKAVFGETIANPALTVLDIEKFAKAAHAHGVPLIVDNTFATPVNCRPFEWGADIVTHSTTKYMDGHGAAVGGCHCGQPASLTGWPTRTSSPACAPRTRATTASPMRRSSAREGAFITKCHRPADAGLRLHPVPQNAFYLNLGLESLHVRMAAPL